MNWQRMTCSLALSSKNLRLWLISLMDFWVKKISKLHVEMLHLYFMFMLQRHFIMSVISSGRNYNLL